MAKTTIHSTSWQVKIDTREFEQGSTATRKQIGLMKKAAKDVLTPLEKYEMEMAELGNLLEKDARFQEVYNRKAAQLKKELDLATKSVDKFNKEIDETGDELQEGQRGLDVWESSLLNVGPAAIAAGAAIAGLAGSSKLALDRISGLDKQLKDMTRFGVGTEHFGTMKVLAAAAREEVDVITDAFKNLSVRVGEAATEGGDMADTFARIGLDAKELFKLDPVAQFKAFSTAIQDIPDYTDQLQTVDKILSDSGTRVLDSIILKAKAVDDARRKARHLGLELTGEDVHMIRATAAKYNEIGLAWEGMTNRFSLHIAPWLESVITILEATQGDTEAQRRIGGAGAAALIATPSRNTAIRVGDRNRSVRSFNEQVEGTSPFPNLDERLIEESKKQTTLLQNIAAQVGFEDNRGLSLIGPGAPAPAAIGVRMPGLDIPDEFPQGRGFHIVPDRGQN